MDCLTKEQKRVKNAIESLKHYINTYENQHGYINYTDETIINDMLYGIGIALDEKYKFAKGFSEFKKVLRSIMGE